MDRFTDIDSGTVATFLFSAVLLLTGHVLRCFRWRGMLDYADIKVDNSKPLFSLTMGYLVNLFVPFRLGEILRASTLSQLAVIDFIYVLATIIFERLLDVIVVIFFVYVFMAGDFTIHSILIIAIFFGAFILLYLIHHSVLLRKCIWILSLPFNEKIKTSIYHLFWSLSDIAIKNRMLVSVKFWIFTTVMWFAYFGSLYVLSQITSYTFPELFLAIYFLPLNEAFVFSDAVSTYDMLIVSSYFFTPLFFVLLYVVAKRLRFIALLRTYMQPILDPSQYVIGPCKSGVPRFRNFAEYSDYLHRKFSDTRGIVKDFEDNALDNLEVLRMFSGGSGAVTALVSSQNTVFVRKFAKGTNALKLKEQSDWLKNNKNHLPVVTVYQLCSDYGQCYYDMEWRGSSREFYEVIHSEPIEFSWGIVRDLLFTAKHFHQVTATGEADDITVENYIENKAVANMVRVRLQLPDLFAHEKITVNGLEVNTRIFDVFNDSKWLHDRLNHRIVSQIHGDLTIENVIVAAAPDNVNKWFLIDPNPSNIFHSPLIDYAKIFQSLHFGYEGLNRSPKVARNGVHISIRETYSDRYSALYDKLTEQILSEFDANVLKEIYLHEIIHYLRLIPYQFERDPNRGLCFFGIFCLLLLDYEKNYPGDMLC